MLFSELMPPMDLFGYYFHDGNNAALTTWNEISQELKYSVVGYSPYLELEYVQRNLPKVFPLGLTSSHFNNVQRQVDSLLSIGGTVDWNARDVGVLLTIIYSY